MSTPITQNTADLQEILDMIEDLPEAGSGNGGSVSVQTDYNENDSNSPAYLKNRPFYEERFASHFSNDDTPNPPSFNIETLGLTCYKVSGLTPKGDDIYGMAVTARLAIGGEMVEQVLTPDPSKVLITDNFAVLEDGSFFIFYGTGTFEWEVAEGVVVSLSPTEKGCYMVSDPGGFPAGSSLDIEYKSVKKIDPKFLPLSNGIRVVDIAGIDLLSGNTFQLDDDKADELYKMIMSGEVFVLKLGIVNNDTNMFFQHSASGVFFLFMEGMHFQAVYNHNDKAIVLSLYGLSSTNSSTYSLRNNTEITFAEFFEMMRASAEERGLI